MSTRWPRPGLFTLVLAAIAFAAILHAPPVRSLAWNRAVAFLASKGIDARADSLRYNLFTLSAHVTGLSLRATGAAVPFFEASDVVADVPWTVIDRFSLDSVSVEGGRVVIERDASGRWNLPRSSGRSGSPMTALVMRTVALRDLQVRIVDTPHRFALTMPAASLDLVPRTPGTSTGSLTIPGLTTFSAGGRTFMLRGTSARLIYDGSTVTFEPLRTDVVVPTASNGSTVGSPRAPSLSAGGDTAALGTLTLTGALKSVYRDGVLNAKGQGSVALGPLAAWLALPGRPQGRVALDVVVAGPVGSPTTTVNAKANDLAWFGLDGLAVDAASTVTTDGVTIDRSRLVRGGARASGSGRVGFDAGSEMAFDADWHGVHAKDLFAAGGVNPGVRADAILAGTARLSFPGGPPRLQVENTSTAANAGGLTWAGRATLRTDGDRWTLTHSHDVAGVGHVAGTAGGRTADDTGDWTLAGVADALVDDAAKALETVRAAGPSVPGELDRVSGPLSAHVALGGTLGAPSWTADVTAPRLELRGERGSLEATIASVPSAVRLVRANASLGPTSVSASGTMGTTKPSLAIEVDARTNDLARTLALVDAVPPDWRPTGAVTATGRLTGPPSSPSFSGTVHGVALGFRGQRVDTLTGSVTGNAKRLTLSGVTARQCPDGVDTCTGGGELRVDADIDLAHERGKLALHGSRVALAPVPGTTPPATATVETIDAVLDGPFASPAGRVDARVADARYGDWYLGDVTLGSTLEHGDAIVDVDARTLGAGLAGRVGLSRPWPFDVRTRLETADLSTVLPPRVVEGRDIAAAVAGRAAARGTLADLEATTVDGIVERFDSSIAGSPVSLLAPAPFSYGPGRLGTNGLTIVRGDTRLVVDGGLGRPEDVLRASLTGALEDLAPIVRSFVPQAPDARGRVALDVTARGAVRDPRFTGAIVVDAAVLTLSNVPAVEGVTVRAALADGVLAVTQADARWQGASASATGAVPVTTAGRWLPEWVLTASGARSTDTPATLDVSFRDLSTAALESFVTPDALARVGGALDGRLSIASAGLTLATTTGALELDRAEVRFGQIPLAQVRPTRLVLEAGRLRVVDWVWEGAGNTLTVSGGANVAEDGTARLDVAADVDIDLRLLGTVSRQIATAGRATASVSLSGAVAQPVVDGQIVVNRAELRVREPRLAITNVNGAITLTRGRVSIDGLLGYANGGPVVIAGEARLDGTTLVESAVRLKGTDVAFEYPKGLRTSLDVDVSLVRAPGDESARIAGTVTQTHGAFREPVSLLAMAQRFATSTRVSNARPGVVDAIALDLAVGTASPLVVDNNYGQFEATAELRVLGTLGAPSLVGRAMLSEGGQIFLGGHVYRITQGAINFSNPNRIEPDLDVSARTRVASTDITMSFTGTPDSLDVTLSSDQGDSQADIASLLVTGRKLDQLSGSESELVQDQVLNLLSGEILGFASRAVGLDSIRIDRGDVTNELMFDPSLVATETDPAARVTVAKRFGDKVEVVLSQNLKDSGALTWIITYHPRFLSDLRVISDDDRNRIYEFRQERSFGGGKRTREKTRVPPPVAPRVSAITMEGADRSRDAIRSALHMKEGTRFDFYRWQRDRERLLRVFHADDRFEATVDTTRAETAGGDGVRSVSLRYKVEPGPRTTLVVEGATFPPSVMHDMRALWTESVLDDFLREDLADVARLALVRQGFLEPQVDVSIDTSADGASKTTRVRVEPGARVAGRAIAFEGNASLAAPRLERAISDAGFGDRVWVDPDLATEPVVEAYAREGYLAASAAPRRIATRDGRAVLPIVVREGRRFTASEVGVQGARGIAPARVLEASQIPAGSPFTPAAVDEAVRRIEQLYRGEGYNDVRVSADATRDTPNAAVRVQFAVTEGPRQRLAAVEITGSEKTRESVIQQSLGLTVGEPVKLSDWYSARKRLYDAGVFRMVDIVPEPIPDAGPKGDDAASAKTDATASPDPGAAPPLEQDVRAKVVLEEWPSIRLRYGFQVSDAELSDDRGRDLSPGIVGELQQRNLFGRAMTAGFLGRLERSFRVGRGYISHPRFFGLPLRTSAFVAAERRLEKFEEFELLSTKYTVGVDQRYRVRRRTEVAWSYEFDRIRVVNEILAASGPLDSFDVVVNVARVLSTFSHDRRDTPFDATRGFFHSSNFEYGAAAFGSQIRFFKYVAQQFHYRKLGPVVAAGAARVGVAWGYDDLLIPSERYYAGGGASVRGYPEDSLGPRGILGDPTGGAARLVFNGELRFPIVGWLRGAGFVDAGNVFTSVRDVSVSDLRVGLGGGVRVATPFALIRVDLGVPATPFQGARTPRWYFSIGQTF